MTTPRRVSSFAIAVVLLLPAAVYAAEREHEFTYKPDGNPQRVSVAGEFNNWSSDANPMIRAALSCRHVTVSTRERCRIWASRF